MPREVVQSTGKNPFAVKVGWSHVSDRVQLGVETDDGRSLFWELLEQHVDKLGELAMEAVVAEQRIRAAHAGPDGLPADTARVGRALLNAMDVTVPLTYRGVWADLNRDGCNRLIRLVRKARDTAFGHDE